MNELILQAPPPSLFDGGRPNLGRFNGPVPIVNLTRSGLARFRLKEWQYTAITTERHFVAFAVVQLGYVANLFAYVVDRQRPQRAHVIETLSPLGRGVEFSSSSTSGTTSYQTGRDRLEVAHRETGFSVKLSLDIEGTKLEGAFDCENGVGGSIIHRLRSGGLAYTHKGSLYAVSGTLRFGDEALLDADAVATIDWTRAQSERETVWKWASFSGRDAAGERLGLNLSAEIYDDANGDSEENFLFTSAGTIALGGVSFALPRAPLHMPWRITSREGDEIDLVFEPVGARSQSVSFGIVQSHFVQPYGTFHGRVRGHEIRDVFGVVEDHRAIW